MKNIKDKQKLIELRARGTSFRAIAEELKVSKATLIAWSRELNAEILTARAIEFEALTVQLQLTKDHRIKALANRLRKIEDELEKRTFDDLSTEKLIEIASKLSTQIEASREPLVLHADVGIVDADMFTQRKQWAT